MLKRYVAVIIKSREASGLETYRQNVNIGIASFKTDSTGLNGASVDGEDDVADADAVALSEDDGRSLVDGFEAKVDRERQRLLHLGRSRRRVPIVD